MALSVAGAGARSQSAHSVYPAGAFGAPPPEGILRPIRPSFGERHFSTAGTSEGDARNFMPEPKRGEEDSKASFIQVFAAYTAQLLHQQKSMPHGHKAYPISPIAAAETYERILATTKRTDEFDPSAVVVHLVNFLA
ncbi:MAG: hypothetical protein HQ503_01005 [Rhodospirillales bacterium]|nr:hypothetical protein [Rhodospirillales bacterium]